MGTWSNLFTNITQDIERWARIADDNAGTPPPEPKILPHPPEPNTLVKQGADLYVKTPTGITFEGDPSNNYHIGNPPILVQNPGHPQIIRPDGIPITNPLYTYPPFNPHTEGMRDYTGKPILDPNGKQKICDYRPLVTGFLYTDNLLGKPYPELGLPPGVTVGFFSRMAYHLRDENLIAPGHVNYAAKETWVAAFNQDGSLYSGFAPFPIPISQASASYDVFTHSIVVVGNTDTNDNTRWYAPAHRAIWTLPLYAPRQGVTPLQNFLNTLKSISTSRPMNLNNDDRENQIFMQGGHAILVSATDGGGVKLSTANNPYELTRAPQQQITSNDGYGASVALDPGPISYVGVQTVTLHGIYSRFTLPGYPAGSYYPGGYAWTRQVQLSPKNFDQPITPPPPVPVYIPPVPVYTPPHRNNPAPVYHAPSYTPQPSYNNNGWNGGTSHTASLTIPTSTYTPPQVVYTPPTPVYHAPQVMPPQVSILD